VFAELPKGVSTPELKIEVAEGEQYRFIEDFVAKAKFEGARIATIDGLRADWPDGWGLVRASNTTPLLVLRFDAKDSAGARARGRRPSASSCSRSDPSLNLPFLGQPPEGGGACGRGGGRPARPPGPARSCAFLQLAIAFSIARELGVQRSDSRAGWPWNCCLLRYSYVQLADRLDGSSVDAGRRRSASVVRGLLQHHRQVLALRS
jgi:hypothetical protein